MASEENPANSGLSRSNPLYEAATGNEGTGYQAGDGKYVDEESSDNQQSNGSSGSSSGDETNAQTRNRLIRQGGSSGGDSSGGSDDSGSSGESSGDSGRAARLLDGSTEDSSGGSSGSSGGSGSSSAGLPSANPAPSRDSGGSSGGSSSSEPAPGFQAPPDTASDSTPDNSGNGGGSLSDGDSGQAARLLDGSTGDSSGSSGGSSSSGGGGGGGPPPGMQAPPSGLEEAPNGRDPADIDPGPASTDPDPAQGIEEGGQFADQAQALEQEAIAQAEDQTGREFTEEDVRVTSAEQNGQTQLEAELTETGQQQIEFEQFQREFQAEQELERRIQQQTDEQLTRGDDFTIDTRTRDDGQTVFSVDFERGPRDTDVSPSLSRGSESADVPDDGDGDMFSGAVSDAEDGLSRVAQLYTRNPNADVDLPGEGSIVNQARQDAAGADSDRFGDTDLTLPFTDIEVGETTAQAGQAFDENVAQPVGQVTGDIADLAQSGATVFGASNPTLLLAGATDPGQVETEFDEGDERVADVVRGEEADKSSDRAFERFAEGAGTGAANIANLPAVANTGIRAGEFAIEAGEQTAAGRGGEFAGAAAGAGVLVGARAAKAAKENPLEVSGQIAGSTVAAGAAIGTASRLAGSGAGRATSAAIQPGEELALAAARRAGRRSGGSSSSRIGSLFERGGGDSPSTSVRTVDRRPEDPGLSVPAESDTGGRLDNLRTFFGDDRGMGDMTLTTSRTRTDTDTSLDAPAESQLPPREAFSSDEEYARALARARAKDDLPPAEEFPNREQFASELDQRARQVADDGVFGQDSKTSFDSETTTDTAVETETQFDRPGRGQQTTATAATALRLESDVQTAAFAAGQTAQEATAAFGVDTVADTIAAPSLALDTNTVTETVTDTETATETTQDLQTDLRQDLDTGLRTRTRTTTRTDLLGESRREVEPEAFLEDAGGLMGLADDSAETTTRRFEYNIASPDDVLSGGEDIGL